MISSVVRHRKTKFRLSVYLLLSLCHPLVLSLLTENSNMYVKQLFLVTLLAFVALKPVTSLSPEQMEKMAKNLRKSCLQKIDTTEALVEGIQRGEFPDDHNLMCYTTCIMKLLRTFKNGQVDFDMMIKQVELTIPPETAVFMKEAINKCRNEEYTGDECQKTYQYLKCHYRQDPENFIFV